MKPALVRLLSSMKFWTTVLGFVATSCGAWIARHGFDMSDENVRQVARYIAGGFGLLLGMQGLQDHGKEAARLKGPAIEGVGGDVNVTVAKQEEVTP